MVSQVFFAATQQIVNNPDRETPFKQSVNHVAADEPGTASNDGDRAIRHFAPTAFMVRTLK